MSSRLHLDVWLIVERRDGTAGIVYDEVPHEMDWYRLQGLLDFGAQLRWGPARKDDIVASSMWRLARFVWSMAFLIAGFVFWLRLLGRLGGRRVLGGRLLMERPSGRGQLALKLPLRGEDLVGPVVASFLGVTPPTICGVELDRNVGIATTRAVLVIHRDSVRDGCSGCRCS